MIDDRSLERSARSWIEEGLTAAPPHAVEAALLRIETTPQERDWHVPWRFRTMTLPARLVAAAVIGALVIAGAVALGGLGAGRSAPTPTPTTAPSSAVVSPSTGTIVAPPLAETFASSRYGYSVKYPTGWAVVPSNTLWTTIGSNLWSSGINDEIHGTAARFSGASMQLSDGQTADQWITAYASPADRAKWSRIDIGGQSGYLTADGAPAAAGAIAPSSVYFDAVVVVEGRVYNFDLDGHVDRA